jgi:hypothetical protein
VPTHNAIRTSFDVPGREHMKSWLVASADEKSWQEVAREEDSGQLNGRWFTRTLRVAGSAASSGWLTSAGTIAGITASIFMRGRSSGPFSSKRSISPISLSAPAVGGSAPSTGRSLGHTWTPSPTPGRVRLRGTECW